MPLLLLPLLIGGIRQPPGQRWSGVDGGLACGLGASVAGAAALWFARFYLVGTPILESDFSQYCAVADAARHGLVDADAPQRSRLVGLMLAPLTHFLGIEDGMLAAALISTALVVSALYVWGFAVGGRQAGVLSALALLSVDPLVLLSRTLSFYPELCAVLAWMAGTTAMAIRTRSLRWTALAAAFTALAPLVDLKAIPWMILPVFALGVVALWPGPQRGARVAVLLGCLAGSWAAGPLVWPPGMGGALESQMASYVGDVERRAGMDLGIGEKAGNPALCGKHPELVWGTGSPLDIPASLRCLQTMRALLPPSLLNQASLVAERRLRVVPYLWFSAGTGAIVLLVLGMDALKRRSLWRLAALGVPLPPFVFALLAAAREDADVRRLYCALLFVPVLAGVAATGLLHWQGPRETAGRGDLLRVGAATGLLLTLLTGLVPSWLSPVASWRATWTQQTEWQNTLNGQNLRSEADKACAHARAEDLSNGQPLQSRFRDRYRFPIGPSGDFVR